MVLLSLNSLFSQWSSDPMINSLVGNTNGEQVTPKVASGNQYIYISWFSNEYGSYKVRLQCFDLQGHPLWEPDGLLVSSHPSMTWITDYSLITDPEDHAVLAFQDIRSGFNNIYAYRISPSGNMAWGPDGIPVSDNTFFEPYARITATPDGHFIFAWQSGDDPSVIMISKYDQDGIVIWDAPLMIQGANDENMTYPGLISAGVDDFILVWCSDTGVFWAPDREIMAQRFDTEGSPVWPAPVSIISTDFIPGYSEPILEPDSNDGLFIAWYGERSPNQFSCFVQHLDTNGNLLMPVNGTELSLNTNRHHMNPSISWSAEEQQLYAAWKESNLGQSESGIFAQKLTPDGLQLWDSSGLELQPVTADNKLDIRIHSTPDGALVTFAEYSFGNVMDETVKALAIDPGGLSIWETEVSMLSGVQSSKSAMTTGSFTSGQVVTAWSDDRSDSGDVYAQNISLSGALGPLDIIEPGDVNQDGFIDVLDIVRIVNIILGLGPEPSGTENQAADLNQDGSINVLDVVAMVNLIVGL